MLFLGKPLSSVNLDALNSLVSNKVPEDNHLDFKQCLPDKTANKEKVGFLGDVTAFANSDGGFIVYGIDEGDIGVATTIVGCEGIATVEQTRLLNMIHDSIHPNIYGIDFRIVTLPDEKWCLVLAIPPSINSPHMVSYDRMTRFYTRHGSTSVPLIGVEEIRQAFQLSGDISVRINEVLTKRLARIDAGETPVPLTSDPKLVLQIMPMLSLRESILVDIKSVINTQCWYSLTTSTTESRINIDGLLGYHMAASDSQVRESDRYLQLFRNGVVEMVDTHLLRDRDEIYHHLIPYRALEDWIIQIGVFTTRLYQVVGITPPVLLNLALIGVTGYRMPLQELRNCERYSQPIDRPNLFLPGIWIEEFPSSPKAFLDCLRPCMDALWNAVGFQDWASYNMCVKDLPRLPL